MPGGTTVAVVVTGLVLCSLRKATSPLGKILFGDIPRRGEVCFAHENASGVHRVIPGHAIIIMLSGTQASIPLKPQTCAGIVCDIIIDHQVLNDRQTI
jgi:hypothetical protein